MKPWGCQQAVGECTRLFLPTSTQPYTADRSEAETRSLEGYEILNEW